MSYLVKMVCTLEHKRTAHYDSHRRSPLLPDDHVRVRPMRASHAHPSASCAVCPFQRVISCGSLTVYLTEFRWGERRCPNPLSTVGCS